MGLKLHPGKLLSNRKPLVARLISLLDMDSETQHNNSLHVIYIAVGK